MAVVVDGGRREGPLPTVVDATVTPIRVLREGALPASFIEGTMLMSTRRKLFSREASPRGLSRRAADRLVQPPATRSTAGSVLTERRASQWLRRPSAAKCGGRSVSA